MGFNEAMMYGAHGLTPDRHVWLANTAGANLVRVSLDWNYIEPTRNDLQWHPPTQLYNAALARGVTPMFTLGFAPRWAREPSGMGCDYWCQHPPARAMDGEWAEFAADAARRFPSAIFEIWNEPNLRGFWESGPDPQRFAELQAIAYNAIKSQSPGATVLAGGFSILENSDGTEGGSIAMGEFVRRAYAANPSIRGHMDGLSFHPFPHSAHLWSPTSPDTLFARAFASIRGARDEAGDSGTPLWVTEIGASTGPPEVLTEAQQADTLLRAYRRTMTMADVEGIVFHRMLQPSWTRDPWELGTAFLRSGFHPEPRAVYCALAALAGNDYGPCPDQADLGIQTTDAPDPVTVGQDIAYTLSVTNSGPGSATSVQATSALPAGVVFRSASDGCANDAGVVRCGLGTLAHGGTATAQVVVTATQAGTISNTATVAGAEADPYATDNSSTATTQVQGLLPPAPPGPPSEPPSSPERGKSVNVKTIEGVALVKTPGSGRYHPLSGFAQVPVGSKLDVRKGRVQLLSEGANGNRSSLFWAGVAQVLQGSRRGAPTELRLLRKVGCAPRAGAPSRMRGRGNKIWGTGAPGHLISGGKSTSSGRGATWSVHERCDRTTKTFAKTGRVHVRDLKRKRKLTLGVGETYVAPGRRR